MRKNEILSHLAKSVATREEAMMIQRLAEALKAGVPADRVRSAVIQGLEQARGRLMSNKVPVSEFLLCLDTARKGLERIAQKRGAGTRGLPVVIGVVEGDPHDLGKDIIAHVYRAHGYQVCDLGSDVPRDAFLDGVRRNRARILALSAMMSTTMSEMQNIIREVRLSSPKTAVIVGGAPLNEVLAKSYGADGYATTAMTVIEATANMLASRGRK